MDETIRVGIVGCGRAAERLYATTLPQTSGSVTVAVADPSEQRRQLMAASCGHCNTYPDLTALLATEDVHAVLVLTPPQFHIPLVCEALNAGKWVLVEKPLASTIAEAQPLLAMDQSARDRVMVGYNRRQWSPMGELQTALKSRGSQPVNIDADFSIDVSKWDALTGVVDPLDDLSSHYIDLFRFILGREITHVSASRPKDGRVELTLKLDDGSTAKLVNEHGHDMREFLTAKVNGTTLHSMVGSNRISPAAGPMRKALDTVDKLGRKLTGRKWVLGDSYVQQLNHFFDCIRKNRKPNPGVEDGLAVMKAVEAARRSTEQNGQEQMIGESH